MKKSAKAAMLGAAATVHAQSYTTSTFIECTATAAAGTVTSYQTMTSTVCDLCEHMSTTQVGGTPVHVTAYTTVYTNACPTGLVPVTYTITESCTGMTPTFTGPGNTNAGYVPPGYTTSMVDCGCDAQTPGPVAMTFPMTQGPYVPAQATPAPAAGGSSPVAGSGGSSPAAGSGSEGSSPAAGSSGSSPAAGSGSEGSSPAAGSSGSSPAAGSSGSSPAAGSGSEGSSPAAGAGSGSSAPAPNAAPAGNSGTSPESYGGSSPAGSSGSSPAGGSSPAAGSAGESPVSGSSPAAGSSGESPAAGAGSSPAASGAAMPNSNAGGNGTVPFNPNSASRSAATGFLAAVCAMAGGMILL